MKEKLLNRNLLMIIIGQMVSIFGNSVLRFALPLYILDTTGSTGIFGTVLAVSSIPVILFSPVGGILADRANKRNMMVILDAVTAVIIGVFCFALGREVMVALIAVMMVLLSLIQSIYQPVVQASMPVVVHKDNLEKANSMVSLVNAFSSMAAPFAAGILYAAFGITIIMIIGSVCFALAAFMEMFIKIKAAKQKQYDNLGKMIKADFKESIHYIFKDNPTMLKGMIVVAGINLFLTSMAVVGLPAIIKIKLGLSSQLYGVTQGMVAAGMIIGGMLAGIFGRRIKTKSVYILLIAASVSLVPIGLAFVFNIPTMTAYWLVSFSYLLMMIIVTIFSITMFSYVQRETPKHLIGKVISYVLVMTQCTVPIGNALYGFVLERGMHYISIIVFVTAALSGGIAIYSKYIFRELKNSDIKHTTLEYEEICQYN